MMEATLLFTIIAGLVPLCIADVPVVPNSYVNIAAGPFVRVPAKSVFNTNNYTLTLTKNGEATTSTATITKILHTNDCESFTTLPAIGDIVTTLDADVYDFDSIHAIVIPAYDHLVLMVEHDNKARVIFMTYSPLLMYTKCLISFITSDEACSISSKCSHLRADVTDNTIRYASFVPDSDNSFYFKTLGVDTYNQNTRRKHSRSGRSVDKRYNYNPSSTSYSYNTPSGYDSYSSTPSSYYSYSTTPSSYYSYSSTSSPHGSSANSYTPWQSSLSSSDSSSWSSGSSTPYSGSSTFTTQSATPWYWSNNKPSASVDLNTDMNKPLSGGLNTPVGSLSTTHVPIVSDAANAANDLWSSFKQTRSKRSADFKSQGNYYKEVTRPPFPPYRPSPQVHGDTLSGMIDRIWPAYENQGNAVGIQRSMLRYTPNAYLIHLLNGPLDEAAPFLLTGFADFTNKDKSMDTDGNFKFTAESTSTPSTVESIPDKDNKLDAEDEPDSNGSESVDSLPPPEEIDEDTVDPEQDTE